MQHIIQSLDSLPILLIIGLAIVFGFYFGKNMKFIRLPSIIGYMILGVILGPSALNMLSDKIQSQLSFVPDIALGFVALSIGMELKLSALKKLGKSIIFIILFESFGAFIVVFVGLYLLTGNSLMALIFASIAPASAPAGTVAVIQEYKAKGNLTKALYAVVGFDDGLGIIIFGFALAIANDIFLHETGEVSHSIWMTLFFPFKEIILSIVLGGAIAVIFSFLSAKIKTGGDIFIMIFGFVLGICGIAQSLHLSLILTNMIVGMIIVNTQKTSLISKIEERLSQILPLLFILFFTVAGSSLHIKKLPSLGLIGLVYILTRSAGLIGGARLGAILGKSEEKIKKYLGLGILSQAGVAIGLSLMITQEFKGMGKVVDVVNGVNVTTGDQLGSLVITIVTATCIVFEIIGPITTKIALKKAGEIKEV